jgi:hypothetical protein
LHEGNRTCVGGRKPAVEWDRDGATQRWLSDGGRARRNGPRERNWKK